MISISINVDAIDEARLFRGKKGRYLDAVIFETPNSQYNDFMIVQSVSKEERERGVKGNELGNGKNIVKCDPTNYNTPPDETIDNTSEDLGF